ncbi:MAG: metallopeptidase TldD-related protein [Erysipelotrichaceae bacterium]
MDKLISILNSCDVSDYQIVCDETQSHQCFFIRHQLDQHRICTEKKITLTIFVDNPDKTLRGSAKKEIFAGETEEEIRADIMDMKENALLAFNPYYPLESNVSYTEAKKDFNLLDSLKNVITAVESIEETGTEKINSYEVFVNQKYRHIINSQGVEITFNSSDEMVEIVINSTDGSHEVEVYHMIEAGSDRDSESIKAEIEAVFKKANDRSKAQPVKKMSGAHVLISGNDLREFFHYFLDKINTADVYSKMSQNKVGDVVQKGTDCDKITLKVKASLPYSSRNVLYSTEAVKATDFTVLQQGEYVNYVGSRQFAHYLGLTDVGFENNFVVEPGSKTVGEMKQQPYLEIVEFSSFQVDPITGDFGGEFRLAYYYDGTSVKEVTAGSITANINEVLDHIYLSKETRQVNNCIIPATIELFNINVAGC